MNRHTSSYCKKSLIAHKFSLLFCTQQLLFAVTAVQSSPGSFKTAAADASPSFLVSTAEKPFNQETVVQRFADHSIVVRLIGNNLPVSEPLIRQLLQHLYELEDEEEIGLDIRGHRIVSETDTHQAKSAGCSLLFGEVLPSGVTKALDAQHLNAAAATSFYDLGMGLGKLAMQAFLAFPSLQKVVGVELARPRAQEAVAALQKLAGLAPGLLLFQSLDEDHTSGRLSVQVGPGKGRYFAVFVPPCPFVPFFSFSRRCSFFVC